jgi:hypothetical protein
MSDTDSSSSSSSDSDSDMTNVAKLGGAKRKNGHKSNCTCHICENMKNKAKRGGYKEDVEKEELKKMGGSKKKNGHKPNCKCPICKNMKHAKKGGYTDDESEGEYDVMDKNDSGLTGGKRGKKSNGHKANCKCPICKKSNGHKANCNCPICKNMKKKGGQEPDEENQFGDIEEGTVKGDNSNSTLMNNEVSASDNEYDALDAAEKGEAGPNVVGGTRKRRGSRKSNGHKANCGCPICKNMRKGKKTRRHRKRSHRRS